MLLLLAAVLAAPDDPKPAAVTMIGGGALVSPDAKLVFFPAKDGGIEAVDIANNKTLWTNKDANKLAGGSDKFVFAWTAETKPLGLRLVTIDAANGKTVFKSDTIPLPDWASTSNGLGRTFRTAARADGDGVLVVWQANAFYAGGARPTPEIEKAARKEATGVVSIDPKTGKVAALDRKPKAEELGKMSGNAGDYEFRVTETLPGKLMGFPNTTTVTMTVLKGKDELWKRELAGNPWFPPPP